jgi:hypothetical protein
MFWPGELKTSLFVFMNPIASSRLQTAAVGTRSDPDKLMKYATHVGMARKAAIESDINKRV